MSGYVASARIVAAAPRLARGGRAVETSGSGAWTTATVPSEPRVVDSDLVLSDGADPPMAQSRLVERGRAVRERWSQLTFYLFDPNSWR